VHGKTFLALGACLACSAFPAAAQDAARGNAFNPKISLILNSQYADYGSEAPADVGGVLLGEETDFAPAGFALGETEMVIESNVDDQWHGWATLAMAEGELAVEEAYVNTLALPAGLALKLGRFKSEIGYQNHVHAHAWEFVDAPIVYRALLGNQLADDGAQLRWVAPADLLVELGVEALRGDGFPAGGEDRSGLNSYVGFVHVGGDAGVGGAWRVGLSHLRADADGRLTGEAPDDAAFTGTSDLSVLDVVFKWAPQGNSTVTNLAVSAEIFRRKEDGDLVFDPSGAAAASAYDGTQTGYYAQAVYQFMPRWRIGLRHDAMSADNAVATPDPGNAASDLLTDTAHDPTRESVMVDFSNSEFSRIRVQYNADQSRPDGERDNQLFVQFIYSLGAHPAHQF
jgi:hypothetical protein